MFQFFCINVFFVKVDNSCWDVVGNNEDGDKCDCVCVFFKVSYFCEKVFEGVLLVKRMIWRYC